MSSWTSHSREQDHTGGQQKPRQSKFCPNKRQKLGAWVLKSCNCRKPNMLTTEEVPKRHIYSWKAHSVGGTQPCIGHPGRRVNSKAWHLSSRPQLWRNTVSLHHTRVFQNPLARIALSLACQWISDLCFKIEMKKHLESTPYWEDEEADDSRPEIGASAQVEC